MYQSFHVKNFRCFDDLELNDLARVNLIAGKNNTGKTSLLEAIMLHSGKDDIELMLRIWTPLGSKSVPPWKVLFSGLNESRKIVWEGVYNAERSTVEAKFISPSEMKTPLIMSQPADKVLEIKYYKSNSNGEMARISYFILGQNKWEKQGTYPQPSHPVIFLRSRNRTSLAENAKRFSELDVSGNLDLLVETLKVVEPRLKSVSLDYRNDPPMIHGHVGLGEAVPLVIMGEGIERITELVLAIGSARDGVVLVDEVENGFHYSVMQDVWKAIGKAAELFNVQVFATTHSWECIVAAQRALGEGGNFRYHRLNRLPTGNITVTTYEREILAAAIEDEFEVR